MSTLKRRTAVALVLGILLFLSVNLIANTVLTGARLDLTQDRLYTVSDGTRAVLSAIDEPIRLRFYFSQAVATPYPTIFAYGRRVQDLLTEYAAIAGDGIELEIIEPEPFSEEEDAAVAAGLQGVPTAGGETLYFGLIASDSTDREEMVPFFAQEREKFLEYDLTRLIHGLREADRPRVALLSSLPLRFGPGGMMAFAQGQGRPYVLYDQLQQFFDVTDLEPTFTAVPADTDVLLIVHPPALGAAQLYAIDQFVLGGGRAAIFLDPYSEAAAPTAGSPQGPPVASDLGPLLAAWGVTLEPGRVVGDVEQAQRVNVGGFGPRAIKDYVLWLGVGPDRLDRGDVTTGNLTLVNLASVGALSAADGAATTLTPLITSSAVSALIDVDQARGDPDPDRLLRDLVPDDTVYTLAARVTGPAETAFPDGPPEVVPEVEAEAEAENTDQPAPAGPHLAVATAPINLMIVADADMVDDRFWVQVQDFFGQRVATPVADNGSFVINAVDNLAGAGELIGLRSRGVSRRPFKVVDAIRREAETRFLAEEQRLQDQLAATEQRIAELEAQAPSDGGLLSAQQEAAIETFRDQLIATRRELRSVQRNLRRDIERLGNVLATINIALVPAVLVAVGIGAAIHRRRRMRAGMTPTVPPEATSGGAS